MKVKFRIWDLEDKVWMDKIQGSKSKTGEYFRGKNWDLDYAIENPELWMVQLFTGLKDKNNKEIYEGDILKFNWTPCELGDAETHIGEVFYDEEIAAFLIDRSGEWNILEILNEEVIGNIFENPELIK